jgi:NAD(P)-dependent dehydrogenase (short-subunit alcohol dehydrogenase family)
MTSSLRLDGKVALITGAARGLGASMAGLFAREGARVLLTDVRDEDGQQTADGIAAVGGKVHYRHLDVTSEDEWAAAVDACAAELGAAPNVLVLNARTWIRGTLLDLELDGWDRLLDVNLRGALLGMRAVVPHMRAGGAGSIVSIGSSMGGEVASGDGVAYQASKAGLTALTKAVAAAYGHDGIRANAVHSGPMRTETLVENGFIDVAEQLAARFPIGRVAEPIEVARVAAFLASDESSYVTASTIVPDGGSSSVMLT